MARFDDAFIDRILWCSPARRIGTHHWRAIVYTLPARYGAGLSRFGFQFRKGSEFGSAPEQWTHASSFPGYARHLPGNGLPKALKSMFETYRSDIDHHLGIAPPSKGSQLHLDLVA
ncbi:hypothetical protein [Robiginitomaculum antarcticum]|uniref:hypothetical protein n=1 Tax=Robiginitomaculum antarcticum TaxID=437507 RepID=UPI000380A47A|nr:hypothetical protein [Robiginitomaculum antarcticum]